MPTIRFIDSGGVERQVDAPVDMSVMQAAVAHKVPGIAGECGGCCLCSACHALVDREWIAKLGRRSSSEEGMLDHVANVRWNSRLTCKIWLTDELDGLLIRTL